MLGRRPDRSPGAGLADSSAHGDGARRGGGDRLAAGDMHGHRGACCRGCVTSPFSGAVSTLGAPVASPIVAQALRGLAPTDPSSLKFPLRQPSSGGSNSVRQAAAGPGSPLGRPDAVHRVPPCVPLTGGCLRPFARTVGTRSLRFTSAHASCRPGHLSACSVLAAVSGHGRERK